MRLYSTVIPAVTLGQIDVRSGSGIHVGVFGGGTACDTFDGKTFVNWCHDTSDDKCKCPPNTVLSTTPTVMTCNFVNGCNPDANDQCNENATCTNRVVTDMINDDNSCKDESELAYECKCNTGYQGDGFDFGSGCIDYNECVLEEDNVCHTFNGGTCQNDDIIVTNKQYTCNCAGEGVFYTANRDANGSATSCTNVDYCVNNPCGQNEDANMICTDRNNHDGLDFANKENWTLDDAYSCSCGPGYFLTLKRGDDGLFDQSFCTDIDECADSHLNDCNVEAGVTKCVNVTYDIDNRGYYCECDNAGGEMDAAGTTCVPVTECPSNGGCYQTKPDSSTFLDLHASCNENGFDPFDCTCLAGWELNTDNVCDKDIDECAATPTICTDVDPNSHCDNGPGDYDCVCNTGFIYSDSEGKCIDIDECDTGAASCPDANSFCS